MLSKQAKRWLRALGLAKLLFEDQAYHCRYLEAIEDFIIKEETVKYSSKEGGSKMIKRRTKCKA